MHFLHRRLSASLRHHPASHYHNHHTSIRTLYDAVASLTCPRDRGLDHAVARERHLKPILNLKDLIISEPSKSIPLSLITQSRETLQIPFRPIEFIRKYPSIFQEFHPGSLRINPHVKLTPETVSIRSEESLLYQSVNYKQEIADRLLKLLMISKINKIPIFILERLKWELGLPQDYEKIIIPEFPDYFRVINGSHLGKSGKILELVCWSDEFAVSEMEKKGNKDGKLQFCLQYSNDFEMDKKYKKWVDEWQKLPYVSPYENAMHLAAKTDEADKWAVAMLHEVLSLFIGKKAERESLLFLGEFLGLRSRFKLAFLQHPGIFYVSNKIGIPTVVLREAYKRGMLIERNPLMDMRYKYVQLTNVVKDENKSKSIQQKTVTDTRTGEGEELEVNESSEEDDAEMYDLSDDDDNNDNEEDEDEDEEEGENATKRERFKRKAANFEERSPKRSIARSPNGRRTNDNVYESSTRFSRKTTFRGDQNAPGRAPQKLNEGENATQRGRFKRKPANFEEKNPERSFARSPNRQSSYDNVYGSSTSFSWRTNIRGDQSVPRRTAQKLDEVENATKRGRFKRKAANFEERNSERSVSRSPNRQNTYDNVYESSTRFSRRTNIRGDQSVPRRAPQKLDEEENATKRGRFKRKPANFEEKNPERSFARSPNRQSSYDNVYKSSTSFSRRTNIRGDQSVPRRATQKLDVSENRVRSKTERTPTQ